MSLNSIKFTAKALVILPLLTLTACNGGSGGGSGSAPVVTPGNLVVTNADSANNTDVVLGGTHQYTVTLANSQNLSEPVTVTVTSSNSQVAAIQSNTCTTTGISATQSCSFYVNGTSTGNATITVGATNYQSVTVQLNVAQEWGTFSSPVISNDIQFTPIQLSVNGDLVYALGNSGSVVKSDGGEWQEVGGGDVITDEFFDAPTMVSDDTHVCVSLVSVNNTGSLLSEVKCSTNGSAWQTSAVLSGWQARDISLYQGNIYVLANNQNLGMAIMSCPLDNCTSWQRQGGILSFDGTIAGYTLFESTGYTQNESGVYYTDENGAWQLYGSYTADGTNLLTASASGVAFVPFANQVAPYTLPVYYNSSSNIGSEFSSIGGGISVETVIDGALGIAMNNNQLFVAISGNIFSSTNISNVWSSWSQVGQNNPSLNGVYINNNKIYSIYDIPNSFGSQVYVYSLD